MKSQNIFLLASLILLSSCRLATPGDNLALPDDGSPVENDKETIFFEEDGQGIYVFQTANPVYLVPEGYNFWRIGYQSGAADAIEVTVTKTDGAFTERQYGFGLAFSIKDNKNFMVLLIDINRFYTVGKIEKGVFSYVSKGWISSSYLRDSFGAANTLTIKDRANTHFTLAFNGNEIAGEPYPYSYGSIRDQQMGFVVTVGGTEDFPAFPLRVEFKPAGGTSFRFY